MKFETAYSYDNYQIKEIFGPFDTWKEAKQKFNQLLKGKIGMEYLKDFWVSFRGGNEELANQDMKEMMGTFEHWVGDGQEVIIREKN